MHMYSIRQFVVLDIFFLLFVFGDFVTLDMAKKK